MKSYYVHSFSSRYRKIERGSEKTGGGAGGDDVVEETNEREASNSIPAVTPKTKVEQRKKKGRNNSNI